jgi:signal transduction histidine kinase
MTLLRNAEDSRARVSGAARGFRPLDNLASKMISGVVLILVAGLGLLTYVNVTSQKNSLLDFAHHFSSAVIKSIMYPMTVGEMGEVQAILEKLSTVENIREISLYDLEGTTKYSGAPGNIGKPASCDVVKKALRSKIPVKGLAMYEGEKVFHHAVPIPNGESCFKCHGKEKEFIGVLTVGLAWSPVDETLRALRNKGVTYSIVCLALAIASILVLLRHLVMRPITFLTNATTAIARQGDLAQRVPVGSADEIGRLGIAFNQMTSSLEESTKELVDAQLLLRELVADLEKRRKELEDFTYIVSHDLKEPLRGITSFSQFVLEDYADKVDEEGKGYLLTIERNAERLKRLIDELLSLSRVTRTEISFQEAGICDIIEEAIERVRYSIEERGIELVVAQDLPVVHCDSTRMVQVFGNLLSNAIKFMDKENPRIEIGYEAETDYHKFFVRDNGIGIDKEYYEKIFGMFQRLHRREDYDGTGAGLHIVQKLIEMHHGHIWVESEQGVGSTFYITLPKKREEREEKNGI